MATKFEEIRDQARQLSANEKAALIHTLVKELDDAADEDVERVWVAEAERRYAEYRAGATTPLNGDEVMARARKRLS